MSDTVQKTADGEEATFYFLVLDLVGCCMCVLDFRYFQMLDEHIYKHCTTFLLKILAFVSLYFQSFVASFLPFFAFFKELFQMMRKLKFHLPSQFQYWQFSQNTLLHFFRAYFPALRPISYSGCRFFLIYYHRGQPCV